MGRTKAEKSQQYKERYRWYKEMGICTTCGREWVEPGHVRCKACEAKIKAYHDRSREKRMERARARRQERINAGLCTECGRRKAVDGKRMCQRCRDMRNDSTRKWKIHQRTLKKIGKTEI